MRQVAWSEALPLEGMRNVRNKVGISSYDLMLAAISGALREYLGRYSTEGHSVGSASSLGFPLSLVDLFVPFLVSR